MTLRLNGSTSGYTEIDAPAIAGSNTLVLPGGNGSANQVLATNGSGTLSFVDRGRMVLETAKASTSGTSIDFTGIPSWVKKITVMFDAVSASGTSAYLLQIGDSGGIETTSYAGSVCNISGTNTTSTGTSTSGYILHTTTSATSVYYGSTTLINISSNTWVATGIIHGGGGVGFFSSGSKTLSDTLDRIRITTANGTDTFDAGSINILYEG